MTSKKKLSTKTKRTIKYLATTTNPRVRQEILASAPVSVIKSICNAALNARDSDIPGIAAKLLKKNRIFIDELSDRSKSIDLKRKSLVTSQKGKGFVALLPIILSALLSTIGTRFISGSENE